jgi:hypothetical protein
MENAVSEVHDLTCISQSKLSQGFVAFLACPWAWLRNGAIWSTKSQGSRASEVVHEYGYATSAFSAKRLGILLGRYVKTKDDETIA